MKILHVEDRWDVADSVNRALEMRGNDVTWVKSYNEATEALDISDFDFDVVITDYELLGSETGADVVSYVKSQAPDLPIMLWSGLTREDVGADFQTTKSDIEGLFNFLKEAE